MFFLLEAVEHNPQSGELSMQANARSAQPPQTLTQIRGVVGQHLFLDLVKGSRDALGNAVHGIGDILDNGLEQRRGALDAASVFKGAARGVDRAKRMEPSTHKDAFRHHEAEIASLFRGVGDVAFKVGNHAIDAVIGGVKLLVGVLRQ
jgi:hypothetical protein